MNLFKPKTDSMEKLIKKNGHLAREDKIQKFMEENEDEIISLWEDFARNTQKPDNYPDNKKTVSDEIIDFDEKEALTTEDLLDNSKHLTAKSLEADKKKNLLESNEKIIEQAMTINNGMAGEIYKTIINLPDEKVNNLKVSSNHSFEELNFDEATSELKALTSKEGEAEIILEYTTKKRLKLKMYINEDPKNMWKDIPSEEEYKPDNESFFAESNDQIVLSASRRGRSHANKGTRRDDHILTEFYNNWSIAIVADGAGSAKLSSLGSKVVSETVMAQLKQNLKEKGDVLDGYLTSHSGSGDKFDLKIKVLLYEILVNAAHNALKAMYEKAKEINRPVKELSTTLSVALIRKFEFGKFVAAFQVGDGAIAVYDEKHSTVDLLCKLDQGEFKSQTLFLNSQPVFKTSESLMERIFFKTYEQKNKVFLMTDGIVDPFFNGEEEKLKSANEWAALWHSISEKVFSSGNGLDKNLLDWMNFYVAGEHDDRSLTIILDK